VTNKIVTKDAMVIRSALVEDVEPVYRVLERGFRSLLTRGYPSRAVEEAITSPGGLHRCIVGGGHLLVAELEGKIIGTITGMEENGEICISSFAVAPVYCRKGVATRLLQELEAIAEGKRLRKLRLEVASAMVEAVGLFEKLGYAREGNRMEPLRGEVILLGKW
jgi:ribosomal protein S18 acetylase RimI-like enzyme